MFAASYEFPTSHGFGSFFLSNDFSSFSEDIAYFLCGELYNCKVEEVVAAVCENRLSFLNSVDGEFSLVVISKKDNNVTLVNDVSGRDLLYYSSRQGFACSTSFWDLTKLEKVRAEDLDPQELKNHIFLYASPEYRTFIKNIFICPNASVIRYSQASNLVQREKYWKFSFVENRKNASEKMAELNEDLNNCFKRIKANYGQGPYAVGLSGGLDSRLLPSFCRKYDMKVIPFIIGESRPHGLLSNDHKSSEDIASWFGLKLIHMDYRNLSFERKMQIDLDCSPVAGSNLLKVIELGPLQGLPLVTGGCGYIVGSSPFYSRSKSSELLDMVIERQSCLKVAPRFHRAKRALNYIFGFKFNLKEFIPTEIPGIISAQEVARLRASVKVFADNHSGMGLTEQLMNYAVGVLGQRNKGGSFESLSGRAVNYTIYGPSVIRLMQTWTEKDLYDRSLFEEYIRVYFPDLAKIKGQDFKVSLAQGKGSIFSRMLAVFMFVLRGHGVQAYNKWVQRNDFLKFYKRCMKENFLKNHMNIRAIEKMVFSGRLHSAVLLNALKMNMALKRISENSK